MTTDKPLLIDKACAERGCACHDTWEPGVEMVPKRDWVGLTIEERVACTQSPFTADNYRAIEAKLKEKNCA